MKLEVKSDDGGGICMQEQRQQQQQSENIDMSCSTPLPVEGSAAISVDTAAKPCMSLTRSKSNPNITAMEHQHAMQRRLSDSRLNLRWSSLLSSMSRCTSVNVDLLMIDDDDVDIDNSSSTPSSCSNDVDASIRKVSSVNIDNDGTSQFQVRLKRFDSSSSYDLLKQIYDDGECGRPFSKTLFAVVTNFAFRPEEDPDLEQSGIGLAFDVGDNLHIVQALGEEWWLAYFVCNKNKIGFIPTPSKLIRRENYGSDTINDGVNNRPSLSSSSVTLSQLSESFFPGEDWKKTISPESSVRSRAERLESFKNTHMITSSTFNSKTDRRSIIKSRFSEVAINMFKQRREIADTEILHYTFVPFVRPLVLLGPSKKIFEVTYFMQKALINKLQADLPGRVIILKPNLGAVSEAEIFKQAKDNKLCILDIDLDDVGMLERSSLRPCYVFIKVGNHKLLKRMIKSRGKDQMQHLHEQLQHSERLVSHDANGRTPKFNLLLQDCDINVSYRVLKKYIDTQLLGASTKLHSL